MDEAGRLPLDRYSVGGAMPTGVAWFGERVRVSETGLSFVTMGLGWDPADRSRWLRGRREIDLNAAALLFAGDALADVVYHEQLSSQDGAVRLLGDSTNGEGDGDNEIITLDLTRIAPAVTTVVLLVTSYTGQTLDEVRNSFCRLVDGETGTEFAHYVLEDPAHGFLVGTLDRTETGWAYREIAAAIDAEHPAEAVPHLAAHLH
ncbi:tellurium resistance TerZ family protein [Nocardia farcinica]|nr:tellurium resistance TerZ family protein [Nocardia farcinica]